MLKFSHGTPFGCEDGASPEKYTEEQLSRLLDLMTCWRNSNDAVGLAHVWEGLPSDMKMEYNFCKWKYVSAK